MWNDKIQTVTGNERFNIEEQNLVNQVRLVYWSFAESIIQFGEKMFADITGDL